MNISPQQKAREILLQVGATVPVDVYEIARIFNITIRRQALEDEVSGMLVVKDKRAIIGVNENHPETRQRFTIAHELAHYFLHLQDEGVFIDATPAFFRDPDSHTGLIRQEIDANTFAAELLMPADEVYKQLSKEPLAAFDDLGVRRLATHFGVSTQALTIRLTRLGYDLG